MANPENLEILKILVQTDAVRFEVPFCICLLFSYHAPFSPQYCVLRHGRDRIPLFRVSIKLFNATIRRTRN